MAAGIAPAVLVVVLGAVACNGATLVSGRNSGDDDKALPITKVTRLLKDMQKDLEKEAKDDKDLYEGLVCWCKKNKADKEKAVEDQKTKIDELRAVIDHSSGMIASLETSIKDLKQDIKDSEAALAKATEIRKEEAAAFHTEEKGLLQSIELLKGAMTALSKHHPAALMQQADQADSELQALRPQLRHLIYRNMPILGFLRTSSKRDMLLRFLDARPELLEPDSAQAEMATRPSSMLLQRSKGQKGGIPVFNSYAPQSGQVMGVLKQMKEAFEEDLPEIQEEEMRKVQIFAEFKGAKEAEIKNMKESKKSKMEELSKTKHVEWEAKDDLEDTLASLSADEKFLLELQDTCIAGDYEYERRTKARAEEIAAVSEAIKILTTDEVLDAQQTTFGFLQTNSRRIRSGDEGARRGKAKELLRRIMMKSPGLSLGKELAMLSEDDGNEEEDPIGKVVKAIDDLVAKLKVQQADEVKHRDFCKDELHENEVETERTVAHVGRLNATLVSLASKISGLEDEIAQLKFDIATLQVELQRATESRLKESIEFQKTMADQMKAIDALKKAFEVLSSVYLKNAFVQEKGPLTGETAGIVLTTVPPAPEFEAQQKHGSGSKVLTLIQKIMGDAKVEADGSVHDEQREEAAYETVVLDTNAAVKAKTRLSMDKSEELALTKEEEDRTKAEKSEALDKLEALYATNVEIHQQCDFLLMNFDARQEARATEMESLGEVKAILLGMQ